MIRLIVPFYERAAWDRNQDIIRTLKLESSNKKFEKLQTEIANMTGKEIRQLMGIDEHGETNENISSTGTHKQGL